MRRPIVLLVMLFAMFWQSVALARMGSTVNALTDQGHAVLHWQEEGHHHHADGSLHQDDSKESVHHGVCDHLSVSLAVAAPSSHEFPIPLFAAPNGVRESVVPEPTLDGLLRPPRFRS